MSSNARLLMGFAGLSLLAATALGAYASHGLESVLDAASLQSLRTALQYQFYNSLGLLAAAMLLGRFPGSRWLAIAGWLLLAGLVLFCGTIYATAFGASPVLGAVTPAGGLCLIGGWAAFTVAAWRL